MTQGWRADCIQASCIPSESLSGLKSFQMNYEFLISWCLVLWPTKVFSFLRPFVNIGASFCQCLRGVMTADTAAYCSCPFVALHEVEKQILGGR